MQTDQKRWGKSPLFQAIYHDGERELFPNNPSAKHHSPGVLVYFWLLSKCLLKSLAMVALTSFIVASIINVIVVNTARVSAFFLIIQRRSESNYSYSPSYHLVYQGERDYSPSELY